MQEMQLYEYAVVRVVPRVERGEFINVGIILYCKAQDFLGCQFNINREKIRCIDAKADLDWIEKNLLVFEAIACGKPCPSLIAKQSPADRFRWLSANRSTIIQCSAIHPGYAADPAEEVLRLSGKLID